MRPIDPAELSAFIDGELDDERAAEVRAALARDPALRDLHQSFLQADAHLRGLADAVTLVPRIRLPAPQRPGGSHTARFLWWGVPIALIAAAWLLARLTDVESLPLTASCVAFLALLVQVVRLVLDENDGLIAAVPVHIPANEPDGDHP